MIRKAKAVWRGTGRDGSGNLSTDSGVLAATPYSFRTRFENEKGICETPIESLDLRIRTSRLFIKMKGVWRQLHYHGSIEEPVLLAEYQRAILGAPLDRPA